MDGLKAYILSKSYVDSTLKGAGAIQGKPGTDGKDGKSAYEIAIGHGFNGTEKEWLESLKGINGKTPDIRINANGNWFINGIDTNVNAKGEKGETGSGFKVTKQYQSISDMVSDTNPVNDSEVVVVISEDTGTFYLRLSSYIDQNGVANGYLPIGNAKEISAIKGEKGDDGITPHIGSNNNWFIGDTDTGILAKGTNGKDGKNGTDGANGENGADGVGISQATITENGELVIDYTNDTSSNLGIVVGRNGVDGNNGKDGENGKDGRSITSIKSDENNNIIVTFSDGTTQNIGQLNIDLQGNFLTSNGFGNLRYYNGHFQYYDNSSSTWIDTSVTPDNVYIMNMTPQNMQFLSGAYDTDLKRYKLKWLEPKDTIVENQVLCFVEKVVIRRKLNSAPIDVNDGILVCEINRKNFGKYRNEYYVDETFNPNIDEKWCYKVFPISTTGFYNVSEVNEISILCKNYQLYGFTIDQNESDPASMITYIEDNKNFRSAYMDYEGDSFDCGDWASAFFMDIKPCMLKYDGTVDYYLNPNDYSKKLDGTPSDISNDKYEGNAMVQIPKVYWKIVDNGDKTANVYISNNKIDEDFNCWSHIDNNGNEIDYCYMPIYNGYNDGTKLRSLSGKTPVNTLSGSKEIELAIANNKTSDVIWYTEVYSDRLLINLLLLLIGKSTDTQHVFGYGHYNGGSDASDLMVSGTMDNKGSFYGKNVQGFGVKVFGIEHYWGNQYRRIAGWINDNGIQKIKMTYGQSDTSTVDGYNSTGNGYITISDSVPFGTSGGYISEMIFSKHGIIPKTANGSSTTYYSDGFYFNNSNIRYVIVGGSSYHKLLVGAFYTNANEELSRSLWLIGSSISCKPLAIM